MKKLISILLLVASLLCLVGCDSKEEKLAKLQAEEDLKYTVDIFSSSKISGAVYVISDKVGLYKRYTDDVPTKAVDAGTMLKASQTVAPTGDAMWIKVLYNHREYWIEQKRVRPDVLFCSNSKVCTAKNDICVFSFDKADDKDEQNATGTIKAGTKFYTLWTYKQEHILITTADYSTYGWITLERLNSKDVEITSSGEEISVIPTVKKDVKGLFGIKSATTSNSTGE